MTKLAYYHLPLVTYDDLMATKVKFLEVLEVSPYGVKVTLDDGSCGIFTEWQPAEDFILHKQGGLPRGIHKGMHGDVTTTNFKNG